MKPSFPRRMAAWLIWALTASFLLPSCAPSRLGGSNPAPTAAAKGPNTPSSGGSDSGGEESGGGETFKSSPELVRATIQKAYEAIIFSEGRTSYDSNGKTTREYEPLKIRELLLESTSDESDKKLIERLFSIGEAGEISLVDTNRAENAALSVLLGESQLQLSKNNTCQSVDKIHPDAAVARHKIGAPICFNVGRLTRISPAALPSEIFALFIHELAHLRGFNEADATHVQKIAADGIAREIALTEEFFVGLLADLKVLTKVLDNALSDLRSDVAALTDDSVYMSHRELDHRRMRFLRIQSIAEIINPLSNRMSLESCGLSLEFIAHPFSNPEFSVSLGEQALPIPTSKILDYRQHVSNTIQRCSEFNEVWRQIRAGRVKMLGTESHGAKAKGGSL